MKQADIHNKKSLGLYFHIPFCVKKCNYCDFLSFAAKESFSLYQDYVDALCNEIFAYRYLGRKYELATIYFGGGTPSILLLEQVEQLMAAVYRSFSVSPVAEITIECNPGTTDEQKLTGYRSLGINRLSLGLQSVVDEQLKRLGRIHTYGQFLEQYETARKAGFENISVDLMSALPEQTLAEYETSLQTVIALQPEHISSYDLIMEEGTPFYEDEKIWAALPEEELAIAMYEMTGALLLDAGYEQYEISNYCKHGMHSRHNSSYWTGKPYLGVGLNAASYLEVEEVFADLVEGAAGQWLRFRNTANMSEYLLQYGITGSTMWHNSMEERAACRYCGRHWQEIEVLSDKGLMEEFVFLGLRRTEGIRLLEFQQRFQVSFGTIYQKQLEKHRALGNLMTYEKEGQTYLALTPVGILVSNQVFVDFLL